ARYLPIVRRYFLEEIHGSSEEDWLSKSQGLDCTDPRLQFVAADPEHVFTPEERNRFIDENLGLPGHLISGEYDPRVFTLLGMTAPRNATELQAIAHLADSPYAWVRLLPLLAMDDLYTRRSQRHAFSHGARDDSWANFGDLDVAAFLRRVREG